MKKQLMTSMLSVLLLLTLIFNGVAGLKTYAFASSLESGQTSIIECYLDKWAIAKKVEIGPEIDGILDDLAWIDVDSLSNFVTPYFNEPSGAHSDVKLVYDDEKIYIGIDYRNVEGKDSLCNLDIIISPTNYSTKYFYIPVKVKDIDTRYSNNWGSNIERLENVQTEVRKNDGRVTVEVAIPFSLMGIDKILDGDEWRLNVIAQHEMETEPLISWIPIRKSSIHYTGSGASNVYGNITDEGRLGSIFMECLPRDIMSTPWKPEDFTLEYKGFTEKKISFKQSNIKSNNMDIRLRWKAPNEKWVYINDFTIENIGDRYEILFKHPKALKNGLYQLQIIIEDNNKEDVKSCIATFDRHGMIHAGDNLYANKNQNNRKNVDLKPASTEVQKLLDLIPEKVGFNFTGDPDQPHLKPAPNLFTWNVKNPDVLKSKHGRKLTYPNEEYPEDKKLIVKNLKGEEVEYPYYEDADGKRYFLTAHIWYKQKDYVLRQLERIAREDPLGAARLLYRFAQVYEGYVPTNDHLWHNRPVDPLSGPPYHWWGGMWYRWAAAELSNFKYLTDAYAIINETNAFEVLSQEVGENVEFKIINDMFKPSIEFYRTFPVIYHNMEYHNALGLVSIGKALNDPSYIHEAVEWAENFAMQTYLFDGFFKETTISYHNQSTDGIDLVIDMLKGWSDPEGYISPRLGIRLDDLDLRKEYPVLKNAYEIPDLLVYPDGRYFPTQDTWAFERPDNPQLDAGSLLLPASGIARLARVSGDKMADSHLYLTFQPKYGHHHYDPLNLVLYARGQELLPDIGYTHTLYRQWTNSTLAHNTVVVDSSDSSASDISKHGGNIDVFVPLNEEIQVMRANQDMAYPQTDEYSREPWLIKFPDSENNAGYILDIFRVSGGNCHEYTLQGDANHDAIFETDICLSDYGPYLLPEGVKVTEPEIETDKGDAEGHYYGYIYVRNVKHANVEDGRYKLTLSTEEKGQEKAKLNIMGLVEPGQNQLFIGESPSLRATRVEGTSKDNNDEAVKYMMPKMVLRREGEDLTSNFVTVMEPYVNEETPRIENIERLTPDRSSKGDIAVKVTYGNTTDIILSSLNPEEPLVVDDITLQGKMGMIRIKDGNIRELYLVGGTLLAKGNVKLTDSGGPVTGVISAVHRKADGHDEDAFITDTPIPDDMEGKTLVIISPDGKTYGYKIKRIRVENAKSIIEIDGMDPGFVINSDGTSEMKFYPFTTWIGENAFRIENVAYLSYELEEPVDPIEPIEPIEPVDPVEPEEPDLPDQKEWIVAEDVTIKGTGHIQGRSKDADIPGIYKHNVFMIGTVGEKRRLEGFTIECDGLPKDAMLVYRAHVQSYGDLPSINHDMETLWQDNEGNLWMKENIYLGTKGEQKRLEGIEIKLINKNTGKEYEGYKVQYQVHMQGFGWGINDKENDLRDDGKINDSFDKWAEDGKFAGTKEQRRRVEAMRIRILKEQKPWSS